MAKLLGIVPEKTVSIVVLGGAAIVAIPLIAAALQATRGVNAVSGMVAATSRGTIDTRGTAYQGTGALGVLGNTANTLSGGLLQRFGSFLGGAVYDLTHRDAPTADVLEPIVVTAERLSTPQRFDQ